MVVGGVTVFVRTGVGVTGRVVALVVNSDFICCVMVTVDITVGIVVDVAAPFRVIAKYENPEVVAT